MIDLRKQSLPNTVCVNGRDFSIYTDFRVWLEFGEITKKDCVLNDLMFIFKNERPQIDFSREVFDFYNNENARPCKSKSGSHRKTFDFILDGEYIYSAFRQQYGINLLKEDLHWHEFKALFNGLTEDTKMVQIMQMAGYEKSSKQMEQQQIELRETWSFPVELDYDPIELEKELRAEFYGCI